MSSFETREEAGVLVVTLTSAADLNDFRSSTFHDALHAVLIGRDRPRVVFDLGATDYLSSSGVAHLIGLKRQIEKQGGELVLVQLDPAVHHLLSVTKLMPYFRLDDDVASALASLPSIPTA